MKEYIARMFEEKNDLETKVHRLSGFLSSKVVITDKQRELLEKQLDVMKQYLDILHQRIVLENELSKTQKEI